MTGSGGGGSAAMLAPVLINMAVGDTHTIQALSATQQPVTGLNWTSSDPTIVSLSTDDPPILTALAVGHITITAGGASADVTVSAGPLALGTVLWSNPGDGSGVTNIVPAVPSPTGLADVFAFQEDGTVQAVTSDGTVAWTATIGTNATSLPDFQGGLVVSTYQQGSSSYLIMKLDGITGLPYTAYSTSPSSYLQGMVVHPDGTIITVQDATNQVSVVGIDPIAGTPKFTVPLAPNEPYQPGVCQQTYVDIVNAGNPIVAGDGNAYVPYFYQENTLDCSVNAAWPSATYFQLLQVSSAGVVNNIPIQTWVNSGPSQAFPRYIDANIITNADTGVLLSWKVTPVLIDYLGSGDPQITYGMAVTTGTSVSLVNAPPFPNQGGPVNPVLQAQDGSFVGTVTDSQYNSYMIAFDASGNLRWTVANETPQVATADGGVIGASGIAYDQNGNVIGEYGNLPIYSWKGAYQIGSVDSVLPSFELALLAQSFGAVPNGNLTGNGFAMLHHSFGLVFCGPTAPSDGACNAPAFPPVRYAYLEKANLNSSTYLSAVDFSQMQWMGTSWPNIIKAQAYTQYKAAFVHLPAIIARDVKPLYGGNSSGFQKFEHTNYIRGDWSDTGLGQTETICTAPAGGNRYVCDYSWDWFMSYVEWSQQALAYLYTNDIISQVPPISPPSSALSGPLDPETNMKFVDLMRTIGFGIGSGAAHETGHQLFLSTMDCSGPGNAACPESRLFEYYNGDGNSPYFYGNLPGQKIHWSQDSVCELESYLVYNYSRHYNQPPCN